MLYFYSPTPNRKRMSQKLYRKLPHNSAELTAHTKPGLTRGTKLL